MPLLLDSTIHQAVARDGLARVGRYDDGSQHVLYLEAQAVRSLSIADWLDAKGPLPTDPTPDESARAMAARDAARQQEIADAQALRQKVRTLAQSAVGVQVDQLTAIQVRALIAVLLRTAGALDKTGAVLPLDMWS